MLQTSDNIEASTMTYVFDMFGKSVTQMLQASIQQQTAIDELRQQIRSCQTQITNICGTLEDFEDRMSVRLSEMRPTIYTRDGIPIDDALEMLQNKIQSSAEKSISQDETITRIEAELKGKLDIEEFESTSQAANEANDSFTNMSMSIQTLQKELQKQRSEQDSMLEKCSQMVQIQIQRLKTQSVLGGGGFDDSDQYVTKAKFKEVIEKLTKQGIKKDEENESDYFDENDLEGTLNRIKKHSAQVDEEYRMKKAKLDQNLNKVLNMLRENDDEDEDFYEDNYSEEFDLEEFETEASQENECEVRDVGIESKEDNNDSFEIGETRIQAKKDITKRRSVGLTCDITQSSQNDNEEENQNGQENEGAKKRRKKKQQLTEDDENAKLKKEALLEEARKEKEKVNIDSQSNVDEVKITASILAQVMNKIEPILVDFFSSSGVGGVKLDKGEAKELISQLTVLNHLKEDMSKIKMLISIKYDKADAENELSIRITRDEFFSMLMTLFPSNLQIQKAYSNYKKKLPPLKNPPQGQTQQQQYPQSQLQSRSQAQTLAISPDKDRSRSRGDDLEDRHSVTIHQRQVKTAAPSALVPARNSKLLALNQKFLKGADGKYYLRDINTSDSSSNMQGTSSNVVGSLSKSASISPDQAFDFQPFLPVSSVKEQIGRISVPSQHRARTPPDQND
ncbi:hypothetical protein M9Y10_011526 [Tritrichomonas musculus]|uniref:NET domain-containing protein n=1 Tax=Tritrichomonas musculus TaxID=1915356 RepID=A0ABR2GJ16_9EUKA